MLSFYRKVIRSSIWRIFCMDKWHNVRLFCLISCASLMTAGLEGASFGAILLAFSALSNASSHTFLFDFIPFLKTFSSGEQFSLFILIAMLAQVLRSGCSYLSLSLTLLLSTRLQLKMQEELYKQIFRFSFSCISHYKTGDLLQYINTPSSVMKELMQAFNTCLTSFCTLLILIGIMCLISFSLTCTILSLFVISAFLQKLIVRKISKQSALLTKVCVDFNKHTTQTLHGIRAIYTFNRQQEIQSKIKVIINAIAKITKKLALWNSSIPPINEMIGAGLIGASLVIGPYFLNSSEPLLATLLTFVTLSYRLATRVPIFMGNIGTIAYYFGPILRLEEIFREDDKEFSPEGGISFPGVQKEIKFNHISLQYASKSIPAVSNLSFSIKKGETIAIVGASGAGKSSLIDLLLRLYEPTEGSIEVDGKNLACFHIGSWRNYIGVVNQENIIFNETIEENIRFGHPSATLEAIKEACQTAGADEFIIKLPLGYQTPVGEKGFRLSGGEKQKLALARAILKKPEILILDEATSNLDSHSERFIQDALNRLQGCKTMIIIAHRLSTITKADSILVLDQGQLVEKGTHHELLQACRKYAKLWNVQFHSHDNAGCHT